MRAKEKLEIPLLLDADLQLTRQLGLLNDKGNLPHPTALVIEPDGVISYLRVDEDYSKRPSNNELLDALRTSKK